MGIESMLGGFMDMASKSPLSPFNLLRNGIDFARGQFTDWQNRDFSREMSRKSENFSRDQYATQRRDAELDWQRTNEYNSPLQQMQRLREAGLNPHLIYGKGAENTASMVRSSSPGSASHTASQGHYVPSEIPNINWGGFADVELKTAQTDNLTKQGQLLEAETENKRINSLSQMADVNTKNWDLSMKQAWDSVMKSLEASIKSEQLKGQKISNYWTPLINAQNLKTGLLEQGKILMSNQQSAVDIAKGKVMLETAKNEAVMSRIELALNKAGISKNDPAYVRAINGIFGDSPLSKGLIMAFHIGEMALAIWGIKTIAGKNAGPMPEPKDPKLRDAFKGARIPSQPPKWKTPKNNY